MNQPFAAPEARPRRVRPRRVAAVVALTVGLEALLVAAIYARERTKVFRFARQTEVVSTVPRLRYYAEGIRTPPVVPADSAGVGDDEEVLGLYVDGVARAYRLREMNDPSRHIINDVIGDDPVTVTYCNMTSCVRAFRGRHGDGPLPISQAGLYGGHMVVRVGKVDYLQDDGKIIDVDPGGASVAWPYAETPFVRTTWREWKRRHPETTIYAGALPKTLSTRPAPQPSGNTDGRSPR